MKVTERMQLDAAVPELVGDLTGEVDSNSCNIYCVELGIYVTI